MATPSIMNAGQRTGAYAPGSIAAMPRRHAGGVRRRDESPEAFRYRMDMNALTHGQMPAGIMPPGMAQIPGGNRTDRIIAARMEINPDGTTAFDTKRNQFNAANAGKLVMDEAGNIQPAAAAAAPPAGNPTPPATPTTPPAAVPPRPGTKPPAPAQMAANVTAGIVGGPAAATMSQVAGAAAAMPPRKPATFEGKPMAQFKAQRPAPAARPTSANPAARRSAGGEFVIPGKAMNPNARWQKPRAVVPSRTPQLALG